MTIIGVSGSSFEPRGGYYFRSAGQVESVDVGDLTMRQHKHARSREFVVFAKHRVIAKFDVS
jgi:hypothetical protein